MEFSALFIRNVEGTISLEETLTNIAKAVQGQIEKEASLSEGIGVHVHAVFDKHKGRVLPFPALISAVVSAMGTPLSEYKETSEAIAVWVRANPEFIVNKGKGGGVARRSDFPVK